MSNWVRDGWFFSLLLLVYLSGCGTVLGQTSAGEPAKDDISGRVFRAGAAVANITPPLGELIVGGWQPVPARHIHDQLHARCLVLDDGTTRIGIAICDNVGIPQEVFESAKAMIAAETDLQASHVLLSATHTHSATTARGPSKVLVQDDFTDYQKFLGRRIADGMRCAVNRLAPAKIAWGSIDEPTEVFNRRWLVSDSRLATNPFGGVDRVRMNPPRGNAALDRQAGPVDPEVSFLSLKHADGRPLALLANYSLHYVGGVPSGEVSADYFACFANAIAKRFGQGEADSQFVAMMSNGTSGDVNNIDFRESKSKRYQPYEKMQEVAAKLADKVSMAHDEVEYQEWVRLSAAASKLTLNVRKPTEEMRRYLDRAASESDDAPRHRREAIYADRLAMLDQAPETVDVQLQVLGIGALAITAIPFETFAETGLELKARSPRDTTFNIELANGSFGYLPTPGQHRLGGYETWLGTNCVQKDASTLIVARLLELMNSLGPAR